MAAQLTSGNLNVLSDLENGSGANGHVKMQEKAIHIPKSVVGLIIRQG